MVGGRGLDGTGMEWNGSRNHTGTGNLPVIIRNRTPPSNGHIAQRADRIIGVAANRLRREVAGGVDDQRAGELHDVRPSLLDAAEGAEGFGEGAEALPEREVGGGRWCFAEGGFVGGGVGWRRWRWLGVAGGRVGAFGGVRDGLLLAGGGAPP